MVISSRKSENFELFCPLGAMKLGVKSVCVCVCWRLFPLLAQIWYGAFYIWGIDAIKFLWKSGEGVGG